MKQIKNNNFLANTAEAAYGVLHLFRYIKIWTHDTSLCLITWNICQRHLRNNTNCSCWWKAMVLCENNKTTGVDNYGPGPHNAVREGICAARRAATRTWIVHILSLC